jgi:hypothetical protein
MAHKNTALQDKIIGHWEAFDNDGIENLKYQDLQHVRNAYKGLGELFEKKNKESDVGFLTDLPQIFLDISDAMRTANINPVEQEVTNFIQNGYGYLAEHQQQLYDINSYYYDLGHAGRRRHNDKTYFYADAAEFLSFFSLSDKSKELCCAFMVNSKDTWHKETGRHLDKAIQNKNLELNGTNITLMLKQAQIIGLDEMSYHNEKGGMILTANKCISKEFSEEKQQLVTTHYHMVGNNSFAKAGPRGIKSQAFYKIPEQN